MKRVLIVEDQRDIRELIKLTLEFEDFEVHEVDSGDRCLECIGKLRPDLVLLDLMMPGLTNGFDVCQRIKADASLRKTKIVMLTARNQEADRKKGMALGADGYLAKPFSPRTLLEEVQRHVGH